MAAQSVEQGGGESEVAFGEVVGILGTVHTGEIEHEVGLAAVAVEFFGSRVDVVLEHLLDSDGVVAGLSVLYVFELCAEVATHESPGTGY